MRRTGIVLGRESSSMTLPRSERLVPSRGERASVAVLYTQFSSSRTLPGEIALRDQLNCRRRKAMVLHISRVSAVSFQECPRSVGLPILRWIGDRLVSELELTIDPERQPRRFEMINGAVSRRHWSMDDKGRSHRRDPGAERGDLGGCPALRAAAAAERSQACYVRRTGHSRLCSGGGFGGATGTTRWAYIRAPELKAAA